MAMGVNVLRLGSKGKVKQPLPFHSVFFSTNSKSPFSSLLRDIKDSLKQTSASPSTDVILKNLNEFRVRTTPPPPSPSSSSPSPSPSPSQQQQISLQSLYHQKMHRNPPSNTNYLASISASLQNIKPAGPTVLPDSVFGKELRRDRDRDTSSTSFFKNYGVQDLGNKLRMLRPKGMDSFSVKELSQRLATLRKMEQDQAHAQAQAYSSSPSPLALDKTLIDVRGTLLELDQNRFDTDKKASRQGLSILSHLSGTPTFSLDPPKPHLVQKYFHPDNMSSAEKLKIELAKVRDEFKMSESDCGSSRVQIAQLTTKIKHLSAVLHKKDVHSRKGLLAMVQRRKRLLKYLRRTDWDSYCFVISKLGLRDNADHSNKT